MTFQQIQQDVFRRLGYADSPASAISNRLNTFINRWHRRVLSLQGMASLRRVLVTQASVANQATYGIALNSIRWISETTNDRRLFQQTLGWYREHYPDPANATGTPQWWVPLGQSRIHTRPANASELFVISTSASDTGTAYVEVVRSTGYRRSLSVTMNGVTAVSMGAAITDIVDVVDFYVSAAAVGTITLREDSGTGTALSQIPIGATFPRFLRYALAPTPNSAVTYTIDGIVDVVDMANANDEPLAPHDFHDILADGAIYDEWVSRGREREARVLRADIELRIRRLRATLVEYAEDGRDDRLTFEETIKLPIT